jgi:hypothetical protein
VYTHTQDYRNGLEAETIPFGGTQDGSHGGMTDPTPQDRGSSEPQDQEQDDVTSPSDQARRDATVNAVMAPLARCADVERWKVGHMEWRSAEVEGGEAVPEDNDYRVVVEIKLRSGLWLTGIGRDLGDAVLKVMEQVKALRAATDVVPGRVSVLA